LYRDKSSNKKKPFNPALKAKLNSIKNISLKAIITLLKDPKAI